MQSGTFFSGYLRSGVFCLLTAVMAVWSEPSGTFSVPLPYLSVDLDPETGRFREVFISYPGSLEGWALGDIDDRFVKASQKKRTDQFHKETPQFAHLITDFEAEQLKRITGDLIKALSLFERDLQKGNWDRLAYLDSYLAGFLRGYYYAITAARCNRQALPAITCIADTLYEEQDFSQKSLLRVRLWRGKHDYITRLRIAAREFSYQANIWRKKELSAKKRKKQILRAKKYGQFERAYELFVRMYFVFDE